MIQRIQTLWLAIIVGLSIASFFFPVAIFTFDVKGASTGMVYGFLPEKSSADTIHIIQGSPAWTLIIFQVAICILTLATIFLYNNRQLQMKFIAFAFLLLVAYTIVLFLFKVDGMEKDILAQGYTQTSGHMEYNLTTHNGINVTKEYIGGSKLTTYGLASYFPIGQILCFIFARNAIRKDEQLVRSSDHLR